MSALSDYAERVAEVRRKADVAIERSAVRAKQSAERLRSSHDTLRRGENAIARSLALFGARRRGLLDNPA
jgi:hypothetical protein